MKVERRTLLAAALANAAIPARAFAEPSDELVANARKEGKVMLYGEMITAVQRQIKEGFEARYSGITMDFIYLSGNPLMNRLHTEQRAGRYLADTLVTEVQRLPELISAGYIAEYASPEAVHYDAKFKSPEKNFWVQTHFYPTGIMYNTKAVPAADVPTSYEALLAPAWKGKIALVTPVDNDLMLYHFAGMIHDMGEAKAFAYFRALQAQQPLIFGPGGVRVSQGVATGEFPIGFGFVAHVYTIGKETGSMAVAPVSPAYIGSGPGTTVMAKAPHPNAARLLADYINSRDVQEMLVSVGYVSSYGGIARPPGLQKLELHVPVPPEGADQTRLRNELRGIFGR